MTAPRVPVVARDAGAASALVPVVRALLEGRVLHPELVAWSKALAIFDAAALPVFAFPEDPSPADVEDLLAGAVALLTGTSMRAELDGCFWHGAEAAGIPSVALLDHWTNYAERFTVATPFDTLPTVIAAMDDAAATELVARGCPIDRIRVTGHPRFDDLPPSIGPELRARARSELGIDAARQVVVFASEPQASHYGERLGYTEADAVSAFLEAVALVAPDALAIIKLHPLETMETVREAAAGRAAPEVRILRAYPIVELVAVADVFCGMTSIVLLDAALLGLPTLSVRLGAAPSHFPGVHAELIRSVLAAGELPKALAEALAGAPAQRVRRPATGASGRVCDLLGEIAVSQPDGHADADSVRS